MIVGWKKEELEVRERDRNGVNTILFCGKSKRKFKTLKKRCWICQHVRATLPDLRSYTHYSKKQCGEKDDHKFCSKRSSVCTLIYVYKHKECTDSIHRPLNTCYFRWEGDGDRKWRKRFVYCGKQISLAVSKKKPYNISFTTIIVFSINSDYPHYASLLTINPNLCIIKLWGGLLGCLGYNFRGSWNWLSNLLLLSKVMRTSVAWLCNRARSAVSSGWGSLLLTPN